MLAAIDRAIADATPQLVRWAGFAQFPWHNRCSDGGNSENIVSAIYEMIHGELTRCGIGLVASLPDDWVAPLIMRVAADAAMRHVPVAREAEAVAVCSGAFFAGVRAAAIMGATGLLTCTGELATLNLRHQIPVFLIVSQRGSIDDHRIYQEVQGRRTTPVLQAYDFPYHVLDREDDISDIGLCFETCRLQKRPFVLFLTRRLIKGREARS